MGVRFTLILAGAALLAALAGCAWGDPDSKYPEYQRGGKGPHTSEPPASVFGPDGISLFNTNKPEEDEGGGGIGVNSYLWRASLDTIAFMPLASADPFGGVIITDWYTPPEATDERLKVNIVILGRQLRADGVRASVFRQRRDGSGAWIDATVAPETAVELEDAILTRARQLRIASAGG
ncbi:MAG: DUF3576 domain-containing protein [Rhodospirillales bacterium]|nr:DUF3576 domain-containing protein [Rhodospirillales bacterium]